MKNTFGCDINWRYVFTSSIAVGVEDVSVKKTETNHLR